MILKKDLVRLFNVLNILRKMGGKVQFSYGVAKNIKIISSDIEVLETIEKDIIGILANYNNEKTELVKRLGKPQQNGDWIIEKDDEETMQKFLEELSKIEEKYSHERKIHEERMTEYVKMLEEESIELQLYKMNIDTFPDGIDADQLEVLMDVGIIE